MKDLAEFVSQEICFRLEDKLKDGNPSKVFEKARYSSYIRGKRDGLSPNLKPSMDSTAYAPSYHWIQWVKLESAIWLIRFPVISCQS